ncbi:MAG: hypothetical protein JO053_12560 [Acidobacteria bacterium]|nr:hypothetical protein [Acidobacteriota bacterium]
MLMYALIGLCLVLVGVVGLQFTHLFYADRMQRIRLRHMRDLEHRNRTLSSRLEQAEKRIAEQDRLLDTLMPAGADDDAWADLIEER